MNCTRVTLRIPTIANPIKRVTVKTTISFDRKYDMKSLKVLLPALFIPAMMMTATVPAHADSIKQDINQAGQYLDDSALTTKVKSALAADVSLKTLSLSVESEDGVVTITGKVKTQQDKDAVTNVVKNLSGVKSVHNNVTIDPS